MKKNITSILTLARTTSLLLALTITANTSLKAQPWPASQTDNTLTSANDVRNINCDMIYCSSSLDRLTAIAWDNFSGGGSSVYFNVSYSGGGSVTVGPLPSGTRKPDVVLANNGANYKVGLVYEDGGSVKFRVYDVTGVGGSLAVSLNSTTTLNSTTPAGTPHIDMFADPSTYSLEEFAIVWHQYNSTSSVNEVKGVYDNINTFTSLSTQTISLDGNEADLGAFYSTTPQAAVVYTTNYVSGSGQDLKIRVWDWVNITGSVYIPETGKDIYNPRAEAKAIPYGGGTTSNWMAVAGVTTIGGGQRNIKLYNELDVVTPNTISTLSMNITGTPDYPMPVIASGAGNISSIGGVPVGGWVSMSMAQEFAVAAYPLNYAHSYLSSMTAQGAATGSTFEVNTNALSTSNPTYPALALGSESNGGSELLAAWFDGSNIMYKISANYATNGFFKTTDINMLNPVGKISIYPNPATDQLHVSGTSGVRYNITDVTGRQQLTGTVKSAIDISRLAPGTYFINVDQQGTHTNFKFVKQ